ncbi:MAG: lipopolysaccharide kinase InaA family protein [Pseudomonadales bacterium]
MKTQWTVTSLADEKGLRNSLATMEECLALQGKRISKGPCNTVTLHEINGEVFYMKRFVPGKRRTRLYFVRSRARAEWENLFWFQQQGIPTLKILAYGEEYIAGRFVRGALVTAALLGASDLESLAKNKSKLIFEKANFLVIAQKVASYTRIMHQKQFTHNDLDWRNILVTESLDVYFFDCPGGRFWVWPFLEYRIVKDLAHLDKIARECIPLRWRLWFYKQYMGIKKLNAKDKKRLHKIARYYDGR